MADVDVPPQNLDAEESVLGACMLSSQTYFRVLATGLKASDFYRHSHGLIYEAIARIARSGGDPTGLAVCEELERQDLLEQIGRARIHELASLVPAAANAPHYARIVKEKAMQRHLIALGEKVAALGWNPPAYDSPEELLAHAARLFREFREPE